MFKSPGARYALRCVLVGIAFLVGSLTGNLPGIDGNELIEGLLAGAGASLAYAGLGALSPVIEPNIGNKLGP